MSSSDELCDPKALDWAPVLKITFVLSPQQFVQLKQVSAIESVERMLIVFMRVKVMKRFETAGKTRLGKAERSLFRLSR